MTISKKIIAKAKPIKAIFFDVDGVLTDGAITYSSSGDELKTFNVKDGQIIKPLQESGIIVGAITGRSSMAVERRCNELNLDFFEQGIKDKWGVIGDKMTTLNLRKQQVCYIGDDLIDLRPIKNVGFGVSPKDAILQAREISDYVTQSKGGRGVLREVADLILHAQGLMKKIIEAYR